MEISSNRVRAWVIKTKQTPVPGIGYLFSMFVSGVHKPPLPNYKLLHCSWLPSRSFQYDLITEGITHLSRRTWRNPIQSTLAVSY